jgi:DNA-binding XRE family transcriptional regulator
MDSLSKYRNRRAMNAARDAKRVGREGGAMNDANADNESASDGASVDVMDKPTNDPDAARDARKATSRERKTAERRALGQRVRQLRINFGDNRAEAARRFGVTRQAIQGWEEEGFMLDHYKELVAETYGSSMEWLTTNRGEMLTKGGSQQREGLAVNHIDEPPIPGAFSAQSLPVYAAEEAQKGMIKVFHNRVIDRIPLPSALAGRDIAYALFVPGDAMSPAFRYGDILWIDPLLPSADDMEVVIYKKTELDDNGENAIICTLVSHTDDEWTVEVLKPKVTQYVLPRDEWTMCHRIVGKHSRR